jgi:hypothetical protein
MPMHPASRQTVQKADRLLRQQLLEFVGSHFNSVIGDL